jgi:hypothetical protein
VRLPSLNALGIFLSNNESMPLDALRRATTEALLGDPEECEGFEEL